MSEVTITNIKDGIKLFEDKLKDAIDLLDQADRIGIERLTTLDGYNLSHPRGIFGIMFNGYNYDKRSDNLGPSLYMKKDLLLGVISIIRFIDQPLKPLSEIQNYRMLPGDYTELAVDTLSGIEIFNTRPENERMVFPVRTELVDEDKGVWKYLTTFSIPLDFIKTSS